MEYPSMQVQYRLGDSTECVRSYEELSRRFRGSDAAGSLEVKTNMISAYVMGGRSGEVKALMEQQMRVRPRDAYELAYNAACALIELKDYAGAEEMLLLARR